MTRDEAYRIVQELAQRAWDEGTPLRELLAGDERAAGLDLDEIFDYGHYVRYAEEIVARLDKVDESRIALSDRLGRRAPRDPLRPRA